MVESPPQGDEQGEALDQVLVEYFIARDAGRSPSRDGRLAMYPEWTADPELAAQSDEFLENRKLFDRFSDALEITNIDADHDTAAYQDHAIPDCGRTAAEEGGWRKGVFESRVLFGDYELIEEIARGGMGVIYKARQVKLDRVVAIKMILTGQLASEEDLCRFQRRAWLAANLRHANIVAVHDVGQHDEQGYFSMQYIEGRSLPKLVRGDVIEPQRAARYLAIISDAVHYANEKNTLHRDLKPAKILLDADDRPHITDFGLARQIQTDQQLTVAGAVLGTPSYMSPEQASGKSERSDRATDV